MFTPEKMEQIHIVFSERDIDRVADAVVHNGSLQIVDSAEIEEWAQNLVRGGSGEESQEMRQRREMTEKLLKDLDLSVDLTGVDPAEGPWRDIDRRLSEIHDQIKGYWKQKEAYVKELEHLSTIKGQMSHTPQIGLSLESSEAYSYLTVETGRISDDNIEILRKQLEPVLHILSPVQSFGGMTTLIVIALKRDNERLQTALREAGFESMTLEKETALLSPGLIEGIDRQIDQLRESLFSVKEQIRKIGNEQGGFIRSVMYRNRLETLKQHIMRYFRKTERTCLLSGWIPNDQRESFTREIRRATRNRCIIEKIAAEDNPLVREGKLDVPVQLKNPVAFKPFEIITSAYGMPAYSTIDPTPILGISFILMFGMMFGDVGHGLVLCLTGILMAMKSRKESVKNAGVLLIYGGGSSILFGFLFGSIFGIENLLPTLWVKPMESITQLFKIAIFFGMGMIFMSIIVNMINGIRRRDFLSILFDKAGLLAAVIYWCGIVVASRMVTSQAKGELNKIIPVFMIGSIVLLFLREPIISLIRGRRKLFPEGVATGIMGSIVEILEIFLGFLANTVSFIRVAAFGLAHAGLFMAIFALSDAVGGMAGGLVSLFVLVFGNIGIICLEGLVVSIQAVRLEFYEFFSRFFQSGRSGYRPLKVELYR